MAVWVLSVWKQPSILQCRMVTVGPMDQALLSMGIGKAGPQNFILTPLWGVSRYHVIGSGILLLDTLNQVFLKPSCLILIL